MFQQIFVSSQRAIYAWWRSLTLTSYAKILGIDISSACDLPDGRFSSHGWAVMCTASIHKMDVNEMYLMAASLISMVREGTM